MPATIGVPMAPNTAKIPSKSNTPAIDIIGLKPIEISIGGTIAPGVPKPAIPSKKAVRLIVIKKNIISLDGCMLVSEVFISSISFASCIVLNKKRAPITTMIIFIVEMKAEINEAK